MRSTWFEHSCVRLESCIARLAIRQQKVYEVAATRCEETTNSIDSYQNKTYLIPNFVLLN
jgi:hypothetical protein